MTSALLDELTVDLPAAGADDELVSETAEDKILQTVRSWVDSGAAPQWIECAGLALELRSWRLASGKYKNQLRGPVMASSVSSCCGLPTGDSS